MGLRVAKAKAGQSHKREGEIMQRRKRTIKGLALQKGREMWEHGKLNWGLQPPRV